MSAIFLIPGVAETLRVTGTASIHDDEALRAQFAIRGSIPRTVTRVRIDEAFLHCGKALIRSGLWKPETWPDERPVPNLNVMIRDQVPDCSNAGHKRCFGGENVP